MSFHVAMARLTSLSLVGLLCLTGVQVSAQAPAGQRPVVRGPRVTQATGAIRARVTSIHGGAWRADNTPIPEARLRLRNVVTGKIDATTVADEEGQFVFTGIPEGTYLVEMVSESGKVLTLGQVFTVAPGESVATFVRLGTKVPWFTGFFGNASLAVAASAAAAGVLALSPESVPSVSPNR
jgi:hypothetical protein